MADIDVKKNTYVGGKKSSNRIITLLDGETELHSSTLLKDKKDAISKAWGNNAPGAAASTVTIMVTDQRIVIVDEDFWKQRDTSGVERNDDICWGLFSLCWYPGGTISKSVRITKTMEQRCYQTADLKDVDFEIFEDEQAMAAIEAASGCCMGAAKGRYVSKRETPDNVMASSEIRITFSFAKQVGDFIPSWKWFSDMKASHLTVSVEGYVNDSDDVIKLRDSLLHHKDFIKPSKTVVQGVSVNPGPSEIPQERDGAMKSIMNKLGRNKNVGTKYLAPLPNESSGLKVAPVPTAAIMWQNGGDKK